MNDLVPHPQRTAEVFSYSISYDELIETWIGVNEKFGHVVMIFEPKKHVEYFNAINLPYDEGDMYLSELLAIEFLTFEDAKYILGFIDPYKGPYVQLWSMGKLITDNIEFNPLTD